MPNKVMHIINKLYLNKNIYNNTGDKNQGLIFQIAQSRILRLPLIYASLITCLFNMLEETISKQHIPLVANHQVGKYLNTNIGNTCA